MWLTPVSLAMIAASFSPGSLMLLVVVLAFAWNLGVHYTGAVMGMPYAARAIALWPALLLMSLLTMVGATFASGRVEMTVGMNIISQRQVTIADATVIVLAAGLLTLLYNYYRIPTSTIQILVFCIVGVGLAAHIPILWTTIGRLAIVWICAPLVACVLGFLFTRLLDLVVPPLVTKAQMQATVAALGSTEGAALPPRRAWFPGVRYALAPEVRKLVSARGTLLALRLLPVLLILVGMAASFVLGANDVSNATGALIMTHQFPLMLAGLIGGVAMAIGALTWGRGILHRVAFDVVRMDLSMASAAQGVQALVVLAAVTQGFFTSMNQALIGAMAGTGLARGQQTVQWAQIRGILRGWLIGPLSGLALGYILEWAVRLALHS